MIFLLDTDTCVFWLRDQAGVRSRLTEVGPTAVGISICTLAELYYGAASSARPGPNRQAVDNFISGISILPVTPEITSVFAGIKATLRVQGLLIEDFDLVIAATAITHGLTLVTNNLEHFRRVPGLVLDNWAHP